MYLSLDRVSKNIHAYVELQYWKQTEKNQIYNDSSIWAWRKRHWKQHWHKQDKKSCIQSQPILILFLFSQKWEEKVHLEFKVDFQFFLLSPRQTHKLSKFKFRICWIGYSYLFKHMLLFLLNALFRMYEVVIYQTNSL